MHRHQFQELLTSQLAVPSDRYFSTWFHQSFFIKTESPLRAQLFRRPSRDGAPQVYSVVAHLRVEGWRRRGRRWFCPSFQSGRGPLCRLRRHSRTASGGVRDDLFKIIRTSLCVLAEARLNAPGRVLTRRLSRGTRVFRRLLTNFVVTASASRFLN
jgi:hypothetical protein